MLGRLDDLGLGDAPEHLPLDLCLIKSLEALKPTARSEAQGVPDAPEALLLALVEEQVVVEGELLLDPRGLKGKVDTPRRQQVEAGHARHVVGVQVEWVH